MVDLLVLIWITFAVWRGRRRGLTGELPSAASATVFFVTGCGLFTWMHRGLLQASAVTHQSLGIFTFVGLLVAAFILWRKTQAHLTKLAGQYVTEQRQRLAGGMAGGVRAFVVCSTLLLILAHWPLHAMTRWIVEGSFVGRGLIAFILPIYGKTHGVL